MKLHLSPKALRVNSGLTQKEVAEYLNMSLTQYKRRENGKSRWYADELYRLAKLYNVDISVFFLKKCCDKTQRRCTNEYDPNRGMERA